MAEKEKVQEELYRKYRPANYDGVLGNNTAVKTIRAELDHGSHVFLFSGPAGTGKTTLARITAADVGAGPLSLFEINSAENRGIDSAREIMDMMRYKPTDGPVMAWILDEFHQQTKPAQEAFLKPLEETPAHVYFFICTTNPEKLIAPLRSRCSIINMKPLSDDVMYKLLAKTAKAERRSITDRVLERIIQMSDGGSRKALKLLGKVLYLDGEKDQLTALKGAGDSGETKEVIDLCRALYKPGANWTVIMELLRLIDFSEPERVRYAVLGYGNSILLKRFDDHALHVMEAFSVNTYDTGKFGITMMAADAVNGD
jgi:DNA polymerase-3 subunit gamma/tau